jgi:DNA-binding CsgD family transcriptional regulator
MQLSDWIGLTGIMIKAQSFYRLNEKDSALLYANLILDNSYSSYQNRFNALYIVTNGDSTLSKERIREYASQREDIRYYEHEPKQNQLSQAVQLLEQDLTRKPDLRWLYSMIGTLVLISFGLFFYVRKKHHKRELLSQQIEELENRNNDTIAKISAQIENNIALLSQSANLKEDLCWSDYNKMCVIINQQVGMLALKLQKTYKLSEREIRLCILTMLNLGYDEIADMLYYAPNGVGKLKLRVAKKLGTTSKNLHHFLLLIAVHEQQD